MALVPSWLLQILLLLCVKMAASQQTLSLQFDSTPLLNNSIFPLESIGEEISSSIQCLTTRPDCCDSDSTRSVGTGDWFAPSGDVLTSLTRSPVGVDFYRDRDPGGIDLRRRNNATSPEGVYRCQIPQTGTSGAVDVAFIGLYLEGNGKPQANIVEGCTLFH